MYNDPIYLLLTGLALIASRLVGMKLQHAMARYSQVPLPLSGREVAAQMLQENGVGDVKVLSTRGMLTDHYNPADKTVNLSEPVYAAQSVAAVAVAAHECGHAVQHAQHYPMLKLRSSIVPLVGLGSKLAPFVIMAGLGLAVAGQNMTVLLVGIGLFASTTAFALITLPVEFDASRRALAWLQKSGIATGPIHAQAKDALFWAAMTYTVAALASIGQLLYYLLLVFRLQGRRAR